MRSPQSNAVQSQNTSQGTAMSVDHSAGRSSSSSFFKARNDSNRMETSSNLSISNYYRSADTQSIPKTQSGRKDSFVEEARKGIIARTLREFNQITQPKTQLRGSPFKRSRNVK